MFWYILVTLSLIWLSFKMGRMIGHGEAVSHCDKTFMRRLVMTKAVMDNMIMQHGMSHVVPDEVSLNVDGQPVFVGTPIELAERSTNMGELIAKMRETHPHLA